MKFHYWTVPKTTVGHEKAHKNNYGVQKQNNHKKTKTLKKAATKKKKAEAPTLPHVQLPPATAAPTADRKRSRGLVSVPVPANPAPASPAGGEEQVTADEPAHWTFVKQDKIPYHGEKMRFWKKFGTRLSPLVSLLSYQPHCINYRCDCCGLQASESVGAMFTHLVVCVLTLVPDELRLEVRARTHEVQ